MLSGLRIEKMDIVKLSSRKLWSFSIPHCRSTVPTHMFTLSLLSIDSKIDLHQPFNLHPPFMYGDRSGVSYTWCFEDAAQILMSSYKIQGPLQEAPQRHIVDE